MSHPWSPRETVLTLAVAVLALCFFLDIRPGMIRETQAQGEASVQDLLSNSPEAKPFTIWGDGQGNVFVSDGLGLFRSTQHGAPGTWQIVLR